MIKVAIFKLIDGNIVTILLETSLTLFSYIL